MQASSDAYPNQRFTGGIAAIDPLVDINTRNVQVRAALKNPEHRLLPGMSATVDIEIGKPQRYITLPQTAVSYNPYGATVFIIAPQSTVAPKDAGKPKTAASAQLGSRAGLQATTVTIWWQHKCSSPPDYARRSGGHPEGRHRR